MPLYDYTCERCRLQFEVSRSFKDSDVPADCPKCEIPAKRQLSVPMAFTKGKAAEGLRQPLGRGGIAGAGGRWGGHGHSHGPGGAGHSH